MAKNTENLVISLDTHNYKITIFENSGTDFHKVNIEEYACESELIENQKLYDILDNVFSAYFDDKANSSPEAYVVLPDYFVSVEHIKLPVLPATKMKEALRAELKKLYPNLKELEVNSQVLSKTKKNITYACTLIKKYLITDCVSVAKKYNLNLKNITFHSNAVSNAYRALNSKNKHSSCVFADIAESQTHLIYTNKDKLLCFQTLPFGYTLLSTKRLLSEFEMSMSRDAEKIVYLAKRKAREKNLSSLELDTEENKKLQLETFLSNLRKNKISLGRFVKKSEEQEVDFLAQNFKTFEKYILLMIKNGVEKYGFAEPENIVVNIPTDVSIPETSIEGIKLKNFAKEVPATFSLYDYLELYGALFCDSFNKGGNFI